MSKEFFCVAKKEKTAKNEWENNSDFLPALYIASGLSIYEACNRMRTPLHMPKTSEMCKKKHTLFH